MAELDPDEEMPLMLRSKEGLPAFIRDKRQPHERLRAMNFILLSTTFERIAFYAFINTLFNTLRRDGLFRWSDQHSKSALYIFEGVSYLSTLFFAVLSDWKLGRTITVAIGFILYAIGYILMTITSAGILCHLNETDYRNGSSFLKEQCAPVVLPILVFVALGAGATKSNLIILGAEQIQDPEERKASRYFEKYAFAISTGIMIAIWVIPSVQSVLEYHHFYVLYMVAISMLIVSALFFLGGWRYYLRIPANETIILKCLPILLNACWRWFVFKVHKCTKEGRRKNENTDGSELQRLNNSNVLEESMTVRDRLQSFLEFAKIPNGGRFIDRHVNDVITLRTALLVFTLMVPFWLVDNQLSVTFQLQGERMRGPKASYVVTWIGLGEPIVVMIGIVILNVFVYKYLAARDRSFSLTRRFGLGMICAVLSMLVAGFVEIARQKQCIPGSPNSRLSIFAQVPQSFLIGLSQLFGMVASYEYAYLAAPRSGQSLFMSLHFCSIGMSFLIGTIYFNVFPSTHVDIDFQCHDDGKWYWSYYVYFFNIAGFQLIFLLIFIVCCFKFDLLRLNRQKLERSVSFR